MQTQNSLKGFRAAKQDSKKQVQKENDALKSDLGRLYELQKLLMQRQTSTESELKDWITIVDLKLSALLKVLTEAGVVGDDAFKTAYEDFRVEFMTSQERQDDLMYSRKNVDTPAKLGDLVVLSVEAFDLDGIFVPDFSSRYSATVLGSNGLLKSIEDAVIGMKAGDTKTDIEADLGDRVLKFKINLLRVKG